MNMSPNQLFCVSPPAPSEPYVFVGGGGFIARTDPRKREAQANLISSLFGFKNCFFCPSETNMSTLHADSERYNVSGAYTTRAWYFALSCYPVGFDILDQRDAPPNKRDLQILMAASFPDSVEQGINCISPHPYLIQLCATEAVGKLLGVGLARDILGTQLLRQVSGRMVPLSPLVIYGRPVHLIDVSQRFKQPHEFIAFIAIPVFET
jgi:hypothetical protein